MKKLIFSTILLLWIFLPPVVSGNVNDRWKIEPDGSITWFIQKNDCHSDHIEMSGRYISAVLRYGVSSDGQFNLNRTFVYPMLRTVPNDTHASFMTHIAWNPLNVIMINGTSMSNERVISISLKGAMYVTSVFKTNRDSVQVHRTLFPSADKAAFIEVYDISNPTGQDMTINIPSLKSEFESDSKKGVNGNVYVVDSRIDKAGNFPLKSGSSFRFSVINSAYIKGTPPIQTNSVEEEMNQRQKLVGFWMNHLVFESPDSVINRMFAFSKIRACESIYQTKGGPMHGPGGEAFYAAIWANDQAEYINPYFPFTGYKYGNESALNSFMHFARFMNNQWKPIPSSIIAEGTDIWDGAGDRGDAAMIAYGASRYALAKGDKAEAKQLLPLIEWCLGYCHHKLNNEGVVASNSDELEGRFPSGKANLNTSSLYYDALISTSYLIKALGGERQKADNYYTMALTMRKNIDKYFGCNMEGFDTYAYYKGNDKLRAWICTPLVMGITERTKGTIDALFSPHLWTENGLLSEEGSTTFWDRSTLYALRGVFYAGYTEKALTYLKYYSRKRLLGEHVPYAIEAWPEGNQRHLSAESGLYGRIITEGIFGIRPVGFRSFQLTPRLPKEWNRMALRKICAFESNFDIEVERRDQKLNVIIKEGNKQITKKSINEGSSIIIKL